MSEEYPNDESVNCSAESKAHSSSEEDDRESYAIDDETDIASSKNPAKTGHALKRKLEEFNTKMQARGVIYIARIPPRMTPMKMKAWLSEYGTVTRIFLQEDDRKKRKGPKRYTEGWVEYESKQIAKRVALSLHEQRMSNHKRNPHYDV
jgi:ESF2/ABP1 family protein